MPHFDPAEFGHLLAGLTPRCCDAWNFFATVRSITNRDYAKAVKG